MKLVWNLKDLFKNIEDCKRDLEKAQKMADALESKKKETLNSKELLALLDDYFECLGLSYRCLVYGSLCYYRDVENETTKELKVTVEKTNAEIESRLSWVLDILANTNFEEAISEEPKLEKYRHFVDDLKRKKKHAINNEETKALTDEISESIARYNDLLRSIKFDNIIVDGEETELNTGNINKFINSKDRETRAQAFKSLNAAYEKERESFADCLNSIVQKRIKLAKLQKYDNVLDKALDDENIPSDVLDELLDSVHQNKRLLRKYMDIKAKSIDCEQPHLYDLGLPLSDNSKRSFPLEEGVEIVLDSTKFLGEQYQNIVTDLLESGHVDAEPAKEKHQSITFSWYGYSFLNYRETYNDMKNLIHELGHATNDFLSRNLPFPYMISSVFIGETASIVNEILLNRTLLEKSKNDEERIFYLGKFIDNYVMSVFRQTMYTEFELAIYDECQKGRNLTPEFLETTYLNLLKSYYGENITYDEESKNEWMRLGKLYRWSYYSYKYATGLLIASTVFTKLKSNELTIDKYIEFLSSGSKEYSLEMLKDLGTELENGNIFGEGFDVLEELLKTLESILTINQKCI